MALRLCVRNGESGVSINASPGSSSLPSFLPSFPAPFLSSFLAILGHSSFFIIYKLCDKKGVKITFYD